MTKADQAVETAAEKLETFVEDARASGGVKAKVADALGDDPQFLRKLKPSLVAARVKGQRPTDPASNGARGAAPGTPSPKPKGGGGATPWLVIGAALAIGYVLAKTIDWRGHAHPRG